MISVISIPNNGVVWFSMADTNGRKHFVNCIIGNWPLCIGHWPWGHIHASLPAPPIIVPYVSDEQRRALAVPVDRRRTNHAHPPSAASVDVQHVEHVAGTLGCTRCVPAMVPPTAEQCIPTYKGYSRNGKRPIRMHRPLRSCSDYLVVQAASEVASNAPQLILPSSGRRCSGNYHPRCPLR